MVNKKKPAPKVKRMPRAKKMEELLPAVVLPPKPVRPSVPKTRAEVMSGLFLPENTRVITIVQSDPGFDLLAEFQPPEGVRTIRLSPQDSDLEDILRYSSVAVIPEENVQACFFCEESEVPFISLACLAHRRLAFRFGVLTAESPGTSYAGNVAHHLRLILRGVTTFPFLG